MDSRLSRHRETGECELLLHDHQVSASPSDGPRFRTVRLAKTERSRNGMSEAAGLSQRTMELSVRVWLRLAVELVVIIRAGRITARRDRLLQPGPNNAGKPRSVFSPGRGWCAGDVRVGRRPGGGSRVLRPGQSDANRLLLLPGPLRSRGHRLHGNGVCRRQRDDHRQRTGG